MRVLWFVLLLSAGSCFAQSPAACPWFSAGSAMETLGGPVEADVHVENNLGTCHFNRSSGSEQRSIEITVANADTHACPAGSARMATLGNEAVQCKTNAGGMIAETIAGRVRDVYFAVAMKNPRQGEGAAQSPGSYGDRDHASVLERVAEQVVGNLY